MSVDARLAAAARAGDVEGARSLLVDGADPNSTNDHAVPVLVLAGARNHVEVVEALIEFGADVHLVDTRGDTVLGSIVDLPTAQVVRVLLDHGADVNHRNIDGVSPLLACYFSSDSSPAVFRLLIERGADPREPTFAGTVAELVKGPFARVLEDLGYLPQGSTDAAEALDARRRGWDLARVRTIPIPEAEARMLALLRADGVDPDHADFLTTWRLFRVFADEPVGNQWEWEGFRFQGGVPAFSGHEQFEVSFSREFEVGYHDDEVGHGYEVLACRFRYEPSAESRSLGSCHESLDLPSLESLGRFFALVECSPTFQLASRSLPTSTEIGLHAQ